MRAGPAVLQYETGCVSHGGFTGRLRRTLDSPWHVHPRLKLSESLPFYSCRVGNLQGSPQSCQTFGCVDHGFQIGIPTSPTIQEFRVIADRLILFTRFVIDDRQVVMCKSPDHGWVRLIGNNPPLGNGDGTFQALQTFSSGGYYAESIAVGDFLRR